MVGVDVGHVGRARAGTRHRRRRGRHVRRRHDRVVRVALGSAPQPALLRHAAEQVAVRCVRDARLMRCVR